MVKYIYIIKILLFSPPRAGRTQEHIFSFVCLVFSPPQAGRT